MTSVEYVTYVTYVTSVTSVTSGSNGERVRRALVALAGLVVVGTAIELAALRHWKSFDQVIPWIVLGACGLGITALLVRPTRFLVLAAKRTSLLTLAASALGIFEHVKGNYESGPLDRVYGEKWDSMSAVSRFWHAVDGSVGPSPLLAPGALGLIGLLVFLSTVDHPLLARPVLARPVLDRPGARSHGT